MRKDLYNHPYMLVMMASLNEAVSTSPRRNTLVLARPSRITMITSPESKCTTRQRQELSCFCPVKVMKYRLGSIIRAVKSIIKDVEMSFQLLASRETSSDLFSSIEKQRAALTTVLSHRIFE